jgi:hypothetical protein
MPDTCPAGDDCAEGRDEESDNDVCSNCDSSFDSREHIECCLGPGDYRGDQYQLSGRNKR